MCFLYKEIATYIGTKLSELKKLCEGEIREKRGPLYSRGERRFRPGGRRMI
ncbi:uncharacterized protein PHALS_03213 [Plasmopara halstedii]|uniref:Uncharacterized protein n=1 Tax=Plasmopara halstedii TaxID=4781 RepID=A0A0P1AZL4_PLAHL|nr:uncharacterized protein PHALS_03213 [Plasmopara halstedii]CEG46613.1 hypothetical protein PHALS_03213 [Plasmopara halstedii]|eukprot:XP_024582982.1 hypothetical protein PHALS_03213 [Plasmopara halstedii]